MGKFSQFFRQGFILVDNNVPGEDVMAPVYKQIRDMANAKVQEHNWTTMDCKVNLEKRKGDSLIRKNLNFLKNTDPL